jgi:hypothetical protein
MTISRARISSLPDGTAFKTRPDDIHYLYRRCYNPYTRRISAVTEGGHIMDMRPKTAVYVRKTDIY